MGTIGNEISLALHIFIQWFRVVWCGVILSYWARLSRPREELGSIGLWCIRIREQERHTLQ